MDEIAVFLPVVVCFLTTVACVWLLRPVAIKIGLVDMPGGRRIHAQTTPLVGGIAMFLGILVGMTLLPLPLQSYRSFVLAAGLLVFIGVLDDFHETPPWGRLTAQIFALLIMIFWAGIRLENLGNLLGMGDIHIRWWSIPITLFGAAALINAVNFIDGLDGLAGGCVLISLLALMVLALVGGMVVEAAILAVVCSAIIAFLCFNLRIPGRKHASIFMGDAGSMLLGLILAWFTIALSQGPQPAASPAVMLWVAGVPLINLASVFILRVSQKRSPMHPGNDHVHHFLHKLGLRKNLSVLVLLLSSLFFASLAIVFELLKIPQSMVFWCFCVLFLFYLIAHFLFFKREN
jgi:undecaprenyl-phosphate alpha-N-acetylglucosaminyl 1-phosphatetransferase